MVNFVMDHEGIGLSIVAISLLLFFYLLYKIDSDRPDLTIRFMLLCTWGLLIFIFLIEIFYQKELFFSELVIMLLGMVIIFLGTGFLAKSEDKNEDKERSD